MGGAVRAGITLTLLASFLPYSSSLLAPGQSPKGTHGGISLLLVAFSPLLIVKTQGNFFFSFCFFLNSAPCLVDALTKQTAESIQVPSHLPWGHTFTNNPLFLQMTGFQPCLHPTDAGGTRFSRVTAQLLWVGMGWRGWQGYTECTGRLAGQNAAAGSSTAQGSGQARECSVYHHLACTIFQCWKAGALPCSSAQKRAQAALFGIKLNRDGLNPPQLKHDQPFSRGIKMGFKSPNLPNMAGFPLVLWERLIHGSSLCLGQH